MERANTILKGIALASLTAVSVFLCLFLFQLSDAVKRGSDGLDSVIRQANTALTTINRPKSGTLWMLNDTILQGRLTLDATNKVLIHEQSQLGTLDKYIADLAGRTSATLTALTGAAQAAQGTLEAFTGTIKAVQPVLGDASAFLRHLDANTKPLFEQASLFVANANTLATNPNVPLLFSDAHQFMLTGNHMLLTGDQVETKLAECTLHSHFTCYVKPTVLFGAQVGGYLLH